MSAKSLPLALAVVLFVEALVSAAPVRAEPTRIERPPMTRFLERDRKSRRQTIGIGIGGFVTGFLAHEAGHIAVNLMLGNVPKFEGFLVWGFVPFFSIAPRIDCNRAGRCTKHDGDEFKPGPRGKYAIVSAGYNVQHITDEVILTHTPDLRYRDAPFRKGLLLFNVFLSCMYAVGDLLGIQDPHGDLMGMRRLSGFHHVGLATALLLPAALDTYRFFVPEHARVSAWASRGAKAGFIGLTFAF